MDRQSNFIQSSDYATIANDDFVTGSVTLPASQTIPAASTITFSTTINVGLDAAQTILQISSSRDGNVRYSTGLLFFERNDGSADYNVSGRVTRSGSTLNLLVVAANLTGSSLTTSATPETFTFYVRSYVTPF